MRYGRCRVRIAATCRWGDAQLLAQALAGHTDSFPDVTVRRDLVGGKASEVLFEASKAAQLLVVGARGRSGLAGLLLGSVSQAVMTRAHCPVVTVRRTM
ncbi:universal stress protein [Streptomyces canus]|uniref:universal stress protein n=1 Tax=Streptomyces canus TaxID=58343 RepID=UPI003CF66C95